MEIKVKSGAETLFTEAYQKIYNEAFPENEKRTLENEQKLFKDKDYRCLVAVEDEDVVGILCYWHLSECVCIEHVAILAEKRGQGIGTEFLKRFCEEHPSVILEIEPPVDEITNQRKKFYQNVGFEPNNYEHIRPAYQKHPPLELTLMSYPKPLTEEQNQLFKHDLLKIVLKDLVD